MSVRELWDRAIKPRGPNYGSTVGDDCEIGGRGLMFTKSPETLRVRVIAQEQIVRGNEVWELRAADVRGVASASPFARRLDPDTFGQPAPPHIVGSDFPMPITQRWLEENVPDMPESEFKRLVQNSPRELDRKGVGTARAPTQASTGSCLMSWYGV